MWGKNIETVTITDAERWNEFLLETGQGHLLQTHEWGELKARYGWHAERLAVTDKGRIVASAQVLFRHTPLGSITYIPKGPTLLKPDPALLREILNTVNIRARAHGAIFLKLEPQTSGASDLIALGFRPSKQTVQPLTTMVLDLSHDLDYLSKLQKPKTRYNIGLAARKGVEIREGSADDIDRFYDLMNLTAQRDRFGIHPRTYYEDCLGLFEGAIRLLLAFFQGEVLAGIMVSTFGKEAIYLYGASGNSHRNLMPNHLLQWEAIKLAREAGCTTYDFWGIPDDASESDEETTVEPGGATAALQGVYRFKKGFGGSIVRFSGAFDYVYSPAKYWLLNKILPGIQSVRRRQVGADNA